MKANDNVADEMWTIRAALEWTEGYLGRKGDENPRLSAQWLLAEACGMRRIELYTNFDRPLSLGERDVLRGYVTRRGKGEPLQYITGEVGFRHIAVKVRPGVLIPRPETEVLVSEALACLPPAPRPRAADDVREGEGPCAEEAREGEGLSANGDSGKIVEETQTNVSRETLGELVAVDAGASVASARSADGDASPGVVRVVGSESETQTNVSRETLLVADICTGSGCIACSLAYEHPLVRVLATDIAPEAVALARENAEAMGVASRVQVLACDLGEGIDSELLGRFDLVVSNPPYVPTAVLEGIPREVADFEPALALDGGADGLDVFRRLLPWCARALKAGGSFAFELHETCLDAAAGEASAAGFVDVRTARDLAGRPRVLVARKA